MGHQLENPKHFFTTSVDIGYLEPPSFSGFGKSSLVPRALARTPPPSFLGVTANKGGGLGILYPLMPAAKRRKVVHFPVFKKIGENTFNFS